MGHSTTLQNCAENIFLLPGCHGDVLYIAFWELSFPFYSFYVFTKMFLNPLPSTPEQVVAGSPKSVVKFCQISWR
jgi:hypothetical protein